MSYRPGDGPKTGSLVQVLAQIAEYARIVAGRMMPDDKAATRAASAEAERQQEAELRAAAAAAAQPKKKRGPADNMDPDIDL